MTGLKLSGQHRGDEWGAVLVAEWHITEGGSKARILIPPAGVHALRSPGNFVKIETTAAHRLPPTLAACMPCWPTASANANPMRNGAWTTCAACSGSMTSGPMTCGRSSINVSSPPAIEAINDFGTVRVKMTTVTWPNSRSRPLRLALERPPRGYRNGCRKRTPQRSPAQGSTQARRPPHDRAHAQAG